MRRKLGNFMTNVRNHHVIAGILVFLGLSLVGVGFILLFIAFTPTPDISSFAYREVNQSTKIYDRTGQILLYDYNHDARRQTVTLDDISTNAVSAVIAIEDSSFYQHGGFRLSSIIRAALNDFIDGNTSQGGSTITQQVVKNTLLTTKKSIARKVHEWVLAVKLEQVYSKSQILETYLNSVSYGGTIYGIESASEVYFGIPAKDLSIAQSAYLAAMLQAPTRYSPYGVHKDELEARKNLVLSRMFELDFINEEIYEESKNDVVVFSNKSSGSIIAPHFVFYILDYIEQKYGSKALTSGLKVITTLDAELQNKAESVIASYAPINEKNFGATNAAMIAVDPQTGQILSMVGSRDFFDKDIDGQYNASLALRQPGSTMKPFAYALALKNGYTRNTVVFDVPTQFSTSCAPHEVENNDPPCYAPKNYDDKFRGPMTFETALAQSINIPAIKVLYLVGIQNLVNLTRSMGLGTLVDPERYGLTLVLGGGEVRLLDITSAYGVFGAGGVRNPATGIIEVSNSSGVVFEQYSNKSYYVIDYDVSSGINAMLSNSESRQLGDPINSPLHFPGYDVAVKTGTTNDTRDAWVVGYTPSIALGVWTGNNDNSKMVKSVAGYIAAPMWHDVMDYALNRYPKSYFSEGSKIYSTLHPVLLGNFQIPDRDGFITPHSLLYWFNKRNPISVDDVSLNDSQLPYWEYGISLWNSKHPELFKNPLIMAPISYINSTTTDDSVDY